MKTAVRAAALASVLDSAPQGIRTLSLDCFDTLLWRHGNLPVDVFTDLDLPGGGMEARMWAETRARRTIPFTKDRAEVTIEEIYESLAPTADDATRAAMVEAELAAEARHCYGFAPTIALMRAAKARGLQIIIVSDTYLSQKQLRALIAAAAGADVSAMIDRIFCSCEHGDSKAGGLFLPVLASLGASPASILHVGDNPVADVEAPARLGIHCVHLQQFDEESEQRLRLEASAASFVSPDTRVTQPAYQPHRAQVALRADDAATTKLGHDVLGPLFHAFSGWLHDEAAAQAARTGKPTKLLFLLRDGYLPAQAYLARYPEAAGDVTMVEISRMTAAMAGMTDRKAIESYILPELPTGSTILFARHLLFDKAEIAEIEDLSKTDFAQLIVQPAVVEQIASRSAAFAERLLAHLTRAGIAPGDSVMLVDLGYNGSVQNLIEPVLATRMGLTVSGRYLLLRETMQAGFDKRGYIDHRHHDLKLVHALSESIALVEQLCTLAQGSVTDYRKDGSPIRAASGIKGGQSALRDAVQAACLSFTQGAANGFGTPPASDTPETRRRMATAILARLLFLPVASEVELLAGFGHDVNLGTQDVLKVVDCDAATDGLRRRGLYYVKNALRAYLPGELRQHGLPVNLSIFASRRFGLDLRKTDFDVGAIKLPVMLMDAGGAHATVEIDAVPTIEGYYQALIPVGAAQYSAGIQFGRIADWVQVEETSFHFVEEFYEAQAQEHPLPAAPIAEGLEDVGGGLLRCLGEGAFLLVPPPTVDAGNDALLLSLVFRPVVMKARAAPAMSAAA